MSKKKIPVVVAAGLCLCLYLTGCARVNTRNVKQYLNEMFGANTYTISQVPEEETEYKSGREWRVTLNAYPDIPFSCYVSVSYVGIPFVSKDYLLSDFREVFSYAAIDEFSKENSSHITIKLLYAPAEEALYYGFLCDDDSVSNRELEAQIDAFHRFVSERYPFLLQPTPYAARAQDHYYYTVRFEYFPADEVDWVHAVSHITYKEGVLQPQA